MRSDARRPLMRDSATETEDDPYQARYVAIIADGNGRWARAHGVPIADGHEAGADTLKARLRDAVEFGIKELTLYSFSTENWFRPNPRRAAQRSRNPSTTVAPQAHRHRGQRVALR
jgi:undecaprenyl pyrophosphate synthase